MGNIYLFKVKSSYNIGNIFLSILILIMKYKIFLEIKGFVYQGLKLYTLSISMFFYFYLFPKEIFGNKYIIKFIEFILFIFMYLII